MISIKQIKQKYADGQAERGNSAVAYKYVVQHQVTSASYGENKGIWFNLVRA